MDRGGDAVGRPERRQQVGLQEGVPESELIGLQAERYVRGIGDRQLAGGVQVTQLHRLVGHRRGTPRGEPLVPVLDGDGKRGRGGEARIHEHGDGRVIPCPLIIREGDGVPVGGEGLPGDIVLRLVEEVTALEESPDIVRAAELVSSQVKRSAEAVWPVGEAVLLRHAGHEVEPRAVAEVQVDGLRAGIDESDWRLVYMLRVGGRAVVAQHEIWFVHGHTPKERHDLPAVRSAQPHGSGACTQDSALDAGDGSAADPALTEHDEILPAVIGEAAHRGPGPHALERASEVGRHAGVDIRERA